MLLSNSICATIVVFLASQALAKDSKTCHTAMTNKNPGRYVPTKTTTHYTSCIKTSKSTIYTTVTPVSTKTETKYRDTTITKPYGVSTTVKTVIVKTDKIITSTSTATATTTKEVISSSIVPAPEYFIPIQASLPGSTNTNDTMAGRLQLLALLALSIAATGIKTSTTKARISEYEQRKGAREIVPDVQQVGCIADVYTWILPSLSPGLHP